MTSDPMTASEVLAVQLAQARGGRCVNAAYCERKECDPDHPNRTNCWCVRVRLKVSRAHDR